MSAVVLPALPSRPCSPLHSPFVACELPGWKGRSTEGAGRQEREHEQMEAVGTGWQEEQGPSQVPSKRMYTSCTLFSGSSPAHPTALPVPLTCSLILSPSSSHLLILSPSPSHLSMPTLSASNPLILSSSPSHLLVPSPSPSLPLPLPLPLLLTCSSQHQRR